MSAYNVIQRTREIGIRKVLGMDSAYHVSGYPTLYLIDKLGRIRYSSVGFTERDRDRLKEEVEHCLAEPKPYN